MSILYKYIDKYNQKKENYYTTKKSNSTYYIQNIIIKMTVEM